MVVILSSTVFSLKSVEVKFLDGSENLSGTESDIVQSVDFKYNESIFFSNKKRYTAELEKNNPYLRVVNIETKFPNKLVVNAVERKECFVIKLENNKYAITDEYLKVLKIVQVYQNNSSNAIEVKNSGLASQTVEVGDFFKTDDNYLTVLFDCFREWKNDYTLIKEKVASIELDYESKNRLLVNMRSGVQIVVDNSKMQLSDKLNLAFSFYETKVDKNGNAVDYTQNGIILITETNDKIYGLYNPAN